MVSAFLREPIGPYLLGPREASMLYQPMRALVIVPTYNEAHNLPPLVAEIAAVIEADILVVDDSSPDGTGQIADDLSRASDGRLKVIHRSRKRGLGTAYVAGFRYALAGGLRVCDANGRRFFPPPV